MKKLIFFNKIEWVAAQNLSGMKILPNNTCMIPSGITFNNIEVEELVGVKQEQTLENNQVIWTLTVSFKTSCQEPDSKRGVAYRLTTARGTEVLIGTDSRPYAIWKENVGLPEKGTESQLKNVTIVLKSRHPMLPIVS